MNVEELRDYCLSLGDVSEKLPFSKFHGGENILVFYTAGHMFAYFDINDLSSVTLKCQPDRIPVLKEQYPFIDCPYNGDARYWIGVDATRAEKPLLRQLIRDSYNIVKTKFSKQRERK